MPLGDFIAAYLERIGTTHVFGIPGDLVLSLFERLVDAPGLTMVSLSHEPSLAFAADGYVRATGRPGVVCVTYGVGSLNVLNAVAGAYAESVPLLVISGGPGAAESTQTGIHHTAKALNASAAAFEQVTCASRVIAVMETAAAEIHAVVCQMIRESKPAYLEIRRDVVATVVPVPDSICSWSGSIPPVPSRAPYLAEAVADAAAVLRAARRPAILLGVDVCREGAEAAALRLAEKLECCVATTLDGKGSFPMDHALYMGVYWGEATAGALLSRLKGADVILTLGTVKTDMGLGPRGVPFSHDVSIWARPHSVEVRWRGYKQVELRDFVAELAKQELPCFHESVELQINLPALSNDALTEPLTVNILLCALNAFLARHRCYDVVAETGDSAFAASELNVPGGTYFSQAFYLSMGFAVPAALGTQLGSGARPLVLLGDHAFQMTGSEVSHAPQLGLNPILVLVNNGSMAVFGPVCKRSDMLQVTRWPYAEMARGWGGFGARCSTLAEVEEALAAAHKAETFSIIECVTSKHDVSLPTTMAIQASLSRG